VIDRTAARVALRHRCSAAGLAALVAVAGLVLSCSAAAALAWNSRDNAQAQMDRRSALAEEAVTAETRRYVDVLRSTAAAAGAFTELTAAKFGEIAAALPSMRLAGATSLAFLVPASDAQVSDVQALWRQRGAKNLVLDTKGSGREHIFSIFSVPLDGSTAPASGIDVSQSAEPTAALTEARRSGHATVSETYHLLRDANLPPAQRQLSFVLSAPVHHDVAGVREFRGWVLMGLRGQDFATTTLRRVSQQLLDITLIAPNAAQQSTVVATLRAPVTGARDLSRSLIVPVANRQWTLQVAANGRRLPGATSGLPTAIAVGGTAFTGLLTVLVFVLATGRRRAHAQVKAATAGLVGAEATARAEHALLTAVLESISDGVGVVDEHGEFLLHNPAAKAMLGVGEDVGGVENWQAHYGIYLSDGRTPFPAEQLPLARALAGERIDQQEMVIRNPGRPDAMMISVSAQPLRARDRPGAVAVFHDITARKQAEAELQNELARRLASEAELREFAGVVAHDLNAPLAAVCGYAEVLRDDLQAGLAAEPTVDKILAGVARMRDLIDDLLTYTTARDGACHLQPVDLQAVVSAVITERTDHLRAAARTGGGGLFPDIYTGPLPSVTADPAMLRQLLDNLIGNALKYTVPGQPARVDISAHARDGDTTVRVEIADRGIGIPPGEHEQVFSSFHRAHASHSYTGTGLGLAICQRIIDRHGGRIGVTDNPGGGSRFWFTLNAASDSRHPSEGEAAPQQGPAFISAEADEASDPRRR
jgi:PAS domain S-box-containing protein